MNVDVFADRGADRAPIARHAPNAYAPTRSWPATLAFGVF